MVAGIFFKIVGGMLLKCFFWIIDVIPSKGADATEAREIVKNGRLVWLSKKFNRDIENWTDEDTEEFASALNWRARWFFKAREKVRKRAESFQDTFYQTGRQPGGFSQNEMAKLVGFIDGNWFGRTVQIAIVSPMYFNSILAFAAIVVAIALGQR